MNRLLKIICAFCFFALHTTSYSEEVLSKEDAKRTFDKSFLQWTMALMMVKENNIGQVYIAGEYDWTMIVNQGHSILKITPAYLKNELDRPHKVSVSVEHNKTLSDITSTLSDAQLKEMVNKWYREMQPEYTVMTEVDLKRGIVQYNFSIFEVGKYPLMDIAAKQSQGCWQQCIKR
jgi:hypothetical protein